MDLDLHVVDMAREMILAVLVVAGPIMLVGLCVGLAVSLIQALTSVQEQTLSLVPKMLAVMAMTLLVLAPALSYLGDYTARVFRRITEDYTGNQLVNAPEFSFIGFVTWPFGDMNKSRIMRSVYKQGKFELVDSVVSSALQVDERRLSDEQISRAYNLRAFAYMAEGKRMPAMQALRKAAETDAKNATAWNNLGVQYMFQGDFPTATSCFAYALELDPTFLKAKFNLGASQRAEGKLEEAEKTFREVIDKKGKYPEAHFNLGVLYLDAETFPGLDTTQRLTKSIGEFEAYKKAIGAVTDSDDKGGAGDEMALDRFDKIPGKELVSAEQADLYIGVANKKLDREKKRLEREKKRQEEEAKEAAEEANNGAQGDAEGEEAETEAETETP